MALIFTDADSAVPHISDVGERQRIAIWLKGMRLAAGKTQREAADHLRIPSQTVSNWETGRHPIDAEDLLRLARFYGVDVRLPTIPPAKLTPVAKGKGLDEKKRGS